MGRGAPGSQAVGPLGPNGSESVGIKRLEAVRRLDSHARTHKFRPYRAVWIRKIGVAMPRSCSARANRSIKDGTRAQVDQYCGPVSLIVPRTSFSPAPSPYPFQEFTTMKRIALVASMIAFAACAAKEEAPAADTAAPAAPAPAVAPAADSGSMMMMDSGMAHDSMAKDTTKH